MLIGTIKDLDLDDVTSSLSETDAAAYDAGTTYNIADEVMFEHVVYGCLVDGTVGRQPDTYSSTLQTPQYWQVKGPTNAYAAVDGVLSVASVNPSGSMVFTIVNLSNIAGVGIFDAIGTEATANFYNISDVITRTETINLSGFSFSSYYDWLFTQPTAGNTNYIFRAIPTNAVKVQITISGGSTELGELSIVETAYQIGTSLFGSTVRAASRSIYDSDEFDVPRYVSRPGRINSTFQVYAEREFVQGLWGRLRKLSGARVVYQADETSTITTGTGILRDINFPIDFPAGYIFTVEIEGVQ